ncbi:hypothetical protein FT663_02531 [Candidozyma haemuli var. vulneris]|uniref:Uncharacterized protein n=1 Tax=Candidozyma haemuli TaxID=45357 RepID=A0A2V1AMG9_9ASCO|nr:hypothetical protein CXQ85_001384 [[Candida] haemuloni]KAF3989705.1 hypothetical protein FT662_02680 [[Candida] haemuloni var. vulneris]KAF3991909.1 hypothetical protein FT663_02531 [[Candida] haemuloni var. vulneris]PVH19089.1 hypothetical protein CXQ85_001384 [[Candida] haemuloni]
MLGFSDENLWRYATREVLKEHLALYSTSFSSPSTSIDRENSARMKEDLAAVTRFADTATAINSGMEHHDPPFAPVSKYLTDLLLPPSVTLRYIESVNERVDAEPVEKEREEELRKTLHIIGSTAASIASGETSAEGKFAALSGVMADHLESLIDWAFKANSPIGNEQVKIQAVGSELKRNAVGCSYSSWLSTFQAVLKSHLDAAGASEDRQRAQKKYILQLRELGNNLMTNLSYPQAIKVYTTAIDSCSIFTANNLAQLHTNRAIAFIGLNCYPEAIQDLKLAISRDRTFVPAYAQLGYCELYMGRTLHALRGYKNALDALAGNIDPPSTTLDFQQKEEYKDAMAKSAFPQFVHKLVQAIILTEKRAKQQRVSSNDLKFYMTEIKKTLTELQRVADPEEQHLFNYVYDENFDQVRSTAVRANQHRPSILTPEVASDILAGSSMEASTVAIPLTGMPGMPNLAQPRRREGNTNGANQNETTGDTTANDEGETATNGETPQTDTSIRGLMNQLGDIFGDMMQAQTSNYFPNDAPRNGEGSNPPPNFEIHVETVGGPVPHGGPTTDTSGPTNTTTENNNRATDEGTSSNNANESETAPNGRTETTNNANGSGRESSPMWDLTESLNHMLAGDYQPVFNNLMRHFESRGGNGAQGDQPDVVREIVRRVRETQASQRSSSQGSESTPNRTQSQQSERDDQSMPDAADLD